MTSWQVGDVRITKLLECEFPARPDLLLPDAQAAQIQALDWLTPHYVD